MNEILPNLASLSANFNSKQTSEIKHKVIPFYHKALSNNGPILCAHRNNKNSRQNLHVLIMYEVVPMKNLQKEHKTTAMII